MYICLLSKRGEGTDNEIRMDNYKAAEKKMLIFNNGEKITSKLLLFAFSVQACLCDMLEQTIITTAYEVFAY